MSGKLVDVEIDGLNLKTQHAEYNTDYDHSVEIEGLNLSVKGGGSKGEAIPVEIEGLGLPAREEKKPEQRQEFEFEGLKFSAKD